MHRLDALIGHAPIVSEFGIGETQAKQIANRAVLISKREMKTG